MKINLPLSLLLTACLSVGHVVQAAESEQTCCNVSTPGERNIKFAATFILLGTGMFFTGLFFPKPEQTNDLPPANTSLMAAGGSLFGAGVLLLGYGVKQKYCGEPEAEATEEQDIP
jgi:hypothetical protein